MTRVSQKALRDASPYSAVLTREQFLFYETRTTARLLADGMPEEAVIERIVQENLFQYPTEKSVKGMARTCIRRLRAMGDNSLIAALASQPSEESKQICLYAMMKQYRLMWDFMVTVIGEKYRTQDLHYSKADLHVFFLRLQEQDDGVATWSDATVVKLKQVINRTLVETGYLDSVQAVRLNPVWLYPTLENAIRSNHDDILLPAFNVLS